MAEPFAGGAGASLRLLYLEETPEICINDADRAIHHFWWAIINRPREFAATMAETPVNIPEWRRQRDLYRASRRVSRLRRGFATFYLNRCNRSGIVMNDGPIGGIDQSGKWRIDARFNKKDLQKRCDKVAEYSARISVSGIDGLDFISVHDKENTFFFIDPPYFSKGKTLYMNALDEKYHVSLATHLKSMTNAAWVLTYDDCPEIRRIYEGWTTIRSFSLRYAAAERRSGQEILIVPHWMQLPTSQNSAAITW